MDFAIKLSLILTETNNEKGRVLSDALRDEIIEHHVEQDMDSMDRDCFRDLLRYGFTGYNESSDMELIDQLMNYHVDEDLTDLESKVKGECELYVANAIENAIGLK